MELIAAVLLAGPLGYLARSSRSGLILYLIAWAVILPIQTVVVAGDGNLELLYWVFNALILGLGVGLNRFGRRLSRARRGESSGAGPDAQRTRSHGSIGGMNIDDAKALALRSIQHHGRRHARRLRRGRAPPTAVNREAKDEPPARRGARPGGLLRHRAVAARRRSPTCAGRSTRWSPRATSSSCTARCRAGTSRPFVGYDEDAPGRHEAFPPTGTRRSPPRRRTGCGSPTAR